MQQTQYWDNKIVICKIVLFCDIFAQQLASILTGANMLMGKKHIYDRRP